VKLADKKYSGSQGKKAQRSQHALCEVTRKTQRTMPNSSRQSDSVTDGLSTHCKLTRLDGLPTEAAANHPAVDQTLSELALIEPLELPFQKQPHAQRQYASARVTADIPSTTLAQAQALAEQTQLPLDLVLLTAWRALMGRYMHNRSIALSLVMPAAGSDSTVMPAAGNDATLPEIADASTLLVRLETDATESLHSLLRNTQHALEVASARGPVTLSELTDQLQQQERLSLRALTGMQFLHSNTISASNPTDETTGGDQQLVQSHREFTDRFDLAVSFVDTDDSSLSVGLCYDLELFTQRDMEAMLRHYLTLLNNMLTSPDAAVATLTLMPADELHEVKTLFNGSKVAYAQSVGLVDLFARQVACTPDNVAVSFADTALSYQQLLDQVEHMASYLMQYHMQPDSLVGVCLPRGIELLVTLLAIQHVGAAYVPLDPEYPADRINHVLSDANVCLFITDTEIGQSITAPGASVLLLDQCLTEILQTPLQMIAHDAGPDHLAYVIYTSGSTGKPKGVQITRRNLLALVHSMLDRPGFVEDDVVLAQITIAFDMSVLEIYVPLLCGARTHIVPRATSIDGQQLRLTVEQQGITVLQATPASWRLLLESGWQGSSHVKGLIGGEALPRDLAAQLLPRLKSLWNLYGPTETTVWCTAGDVRSATGPITIGKPIANYQIYIRDPQGELCPINVPGEICIAGDGMSRGYVNKPELTDQQFIDNPFDDNGHGRLYLTGDIGRWLPDGRIECLGRRDNQVKLRGYRIELGEIESTLSEVNGVDHAVVVLSKTEQTEFLAAYVVQEGVGTSEPELVAHLQQTLPDYMMPAAYTFMQSLPTSPNGKVDRKALPPPQLAGNTRELHNPPVSDAEKLVAQLWSDLLNTNLINRDDNFFSLGGHSLLAMRFVAAARKQFSADLPVHSLLTANLAQLALLLQPDDQVNEAPLTHLSCAAKPRQPGLSTDASPLFEPFHFESANHRLYAVHHSPRAEVHGALLICQPLGHEYMRLQRCVRMLAEKLADAGYHVLRFDYAGTGDSSGKLADMSIQLWQQNIADAQQVLRSRSHVPTCGGIGVRFGATLLADIGHALDSLVLWDPVADGKAHIQLHRDFTYAAMHNLDRYRFKQRRKAQYELFGHVYSELLLDDIARVRFQQRSTHLPEQLLVVRSSGNNKGDKSAWLKEFGLSDRNSSMVTDVEENQRWDDFRVADDMALGFRSVNTIAEWYR